MKTPKAILAPDLTFVKDPVLKTVFENFFLLLEEMNTNFYDDLTLKVSVLPINAVAPSVRNGKNFITANTAGTAYTDYDDSQDGQIITIICNDVNTTIADSGNFKLSAAWAPNADDTLTLVHYNGVWHEIARAAN